MKGSEQKTRSQVERLARNALAILDFIADVKVLGIRIFVHALKL